MKNEDVVWEHKTLFLINKLENVQIEAARVVTGELGLFLLWRDRLGDATGKTGTSQKNIFYKMVNGLVPPYLSAMVPCNFKNIYDYNTRQAVSIPPVHTRTTLYNN
jgi:hypothetical protein